MKTCRAVVPPHNDCSQPATCVIEFTDGGKAYVCADCRLALTQMAEANKTRIKVAPSEPEMEHYLRQSGWVQATHYPQNWCDVPGYGADTMRVQRLRAAVETQVRRDKQAVEVIRKRLEIVSEIDG